MIKILTAVFLILGVFPFIDAFSESAVFTGEWYADQYGMVIQLTLKEDGTYLINEGGEEGVGTWEETALGIVLDEDQESGLMRLDGQQLIVDPEDGSLDEPLIFGRNPLEPYKPTQPLSGQTEAYFTGTWVVDRIYMDGVYLTSDVAEEPIEAVINGTDVSLIGFIFEEHFETSYENGTLTWKAENPEEELFETLKVQPLEDGTLWFGETAEDGWAFILRRVSDKAGAQHESAEEGAEGLDTAEAA